MDLTSACKEKLSHFRIKELKDVLTQLGLAKQGKKQDLVDRILALLSDEQASKSSGWAKKHVIGKEEVAKIVDDTYRKMQAPGATDLATKSHSNPDFDNSKAKEEKDDSYPNTKVQCVCGGSLNNNSMIKCENPKCQVWQHINCVIVPDKPVDGILPEIPQSFYCESCRISRADPFWVTIGHPLLPVKLTPSASAPDGTTTIQNTERTFQLTRMDKELLQRPENDLQVWCILLNDKVSFRMQWPQYADLQVNGVPMRTTNRPGSQLLGINGRDDGVVVTTCSREGTNKICLSRSDARIFCFGIRIARKRTVQQVLSLIPKESAGENFEEALARVCRCIGGGTTAGNADSDSDIEVVADSIIVSLRCPMSGSRMRTAGRFKPCIHMGCFDLDTFVELNQRSRKWQCPICLKNYSLENMIIDPYFNRITSLLRNCGEDVTEIDVKPDGSWRAKNEPEHRDLGLWHLPDSTLSVVAKAEVKAEPDLLIKVKQEGGSDGQAGLKLGIKRNRNDIWEVSKADDTRHLSSGNLVDEKFESPYPNVISMSSSASGSYRDGDDPSVNQDGGAQVDLSANNCREFDSLSRHFEPAYSADNRTTPGPRNADIIVLSDSDEDNITLIPPGFAYNNEPTDNNGIPFSTHPGDPESYPEDPGIEPNGASCLGLFGNGDNFGMPPSLWSQPDAGFQFFSTDAEAPDAFVNIQQNSLGGSTANGCGLTSDTCLGNPSCMEDLPSCHSNTDANGGLVNNPLAFGGDDPSLQIFLPTQPAGSTAQADLNEHAESSNGTRTDDWISLRLGGAGANLCESVSANDVDPGHHYASKKSRMEPLADAASLLLSMNGDRLNNEPSNRQRSDSPLSHPRQSRSAKPRLYFSIDLDSD